MREENIELKNNNSEKKQNNNLSYRNVPGVVMAVITVVWFLYLVVVKTEKGIQAIDWFEIFGAVLLLAGVMQLLWEMIIAPRSSSWIDIEEIQRGKIRTGLTPIKSILVGVLLILLSIGLPILLKWIPY